MKNEDLLRLKIAINCTDDIAYMDCAYLLDKPEFLQILSNLREKYGLTELIPYKQFDKWRTEKIKQDLHEASKNYTHKIDKNLQKVKQGVSTQEIFNMQHFFRRFEWECDLLSRKFKRPGYFSLVIQYAIVCGEVGNDSYQHTRIDILPYELPVEDMPFPEVAILISPMTKIADIKHLLKKHTPKIFEDNGKILKYYSNLKKDTAKNIRRDRVWYWEDIAGKQLKDIYRDSDLVPENFNLNSLEQAVKRYRDILQNL